MENGKQPAFGGKKVVKSMHPMIDDVLVDVNGLTKREYFAGLAMQGLIASGVTEKHYFTDVVSASIQYADEILKQLEDGK